MRYRTNYKLATDLVFKPAIHTRDFIFLDGMAMKKPLSPWMILIFLMTKTLSKVTVT